MEFSFLHIADIHIDRPFSDLSDYSWNESVLADIYKHAVEKSLNNIVDFAIKENVDFVLIAGDTFNSDEQDFHSKLVLKRFLQKLNSLNIDVYLICGNHDPLITYNKTTFNFDENSRTKIIGLNTPFYVDLPIKNKNGEIIASLHALSFKEEKFYENPIKYFKRADNGFNIGLLHSDINGDKDCPYAPCSLTDLKELNYDYFALGHIHMPSLDNSNIQYSGTIQGRNCKETGSHGMHYLKVKDNNIIENKFIPADFVRFEDVYTDISNIDNAIDVFNLIEQNISDKISIDNNSSEIFLIRPFITGCSRCFNEINSSFFDTLSEKIKTDFSDKVLISQAICNISPKINDDILNLDNGISGEIYRSSTDKNILDKEFNLLENNLKKLIENCQFNDEEYENFRRNILNSSKEECKNISSIIYENESIV